MGDVPGKPWPTTSTRVPGHVGFRSAGFGNRVVCGSCGIICLADHELGAYVGVDVDLDRYADDETYEPLHIYAFPGTDADAAFTRSPAQDAPRAEPEPERHIATPIPPAGQADPFPDVALTQEAIRRATRHRALPFEGASPKKSKLARSSAYKKIERRRWRARKRGLDPNQMGKDYELPTRQDVERLERNLEATYARLLAAPERED